MGKIYDGAWMKKMQEEDNWVFPGKRGVPGTRMFFLSPVSKITEDTRAELRRYVEGVEAQGMLVHWPLRDTHQLASGIMIFRQNIAALQDSDVVHVWWDPDTEGGKFDLGAAMMVGLDVTLVNGADIERTPEKSFTNVVLDLDKCDVKTNIAVKGYWINEYVDPEEEE